MHASSFKGRKFKKKASSHTLVSPNCSCLFQFFLVAHHGVVPAPNFWSNMHSRKVDVQAAVICCEVGTDVLRNRRHPLRTDGDKLLRRERLEQCGGLCDPQPIGLALQRPAHSARLVAHLPRHDGWIVCILDVRDRVHAPRQETNKPMRGCHSASVSVEAGGEAQEGVHRRRTRGRRKWYVLGASCPSKICSLPPTPAPLVVQHQCRSHVSDCKLCQEIIEPSGKRLAVHVHLWLKRR
mmetsp:Transcript_37267/g.81951  ORF Transcript_37267/g.81951 Transcript_37267/m.81951 type:complete len:238 (+) Transcript_37267:1027-1740(+)